MLVAEREALTEAYSFLRSHLTVNNSLIQALLKHKVLEERDRTRLSTEVSEERKLHTLCSILSYKDCFTRLLTALEDAGNGEAARYLRQRQSNAQHKCDKVKEQLPHWLRGRYSEKLGSSTLIQDLVHSVQTELFPGLSELCVSSLLIEVVPTVFPSAETRDGFHATNRVFRNVISRTELHQPPACDVTSAPSQQSEPPISASRATEEVTVHPLATPTVAPGFPKQGKQPVDKRPIHASTTQAHSKTASSSSSSVMEQPQPPEAQNLMTGPSLNLQQSSEVREAKNPTSDPSFASSEQPSGSADPASDSKEQPFRVGQTTTTEQPCPHPPPSVDHGSHYEEQQLAEHLVQTVPLRPLHAEEKESTPFLSKALDLRSDPPALPVGIHQAPISPPYQRYRCTEMAKWMTEDVCAWLRTVNEIEEDEIDKFRKAKIKGRALKKMTKEDMREYFPDMPIGTILEILEEGDSFQPESAPQVGVGNPANMPPASGSTVHLEDLLSTAPEHPTNQPVQCTSQPPQFGQAQNPRTGSTPSQHPDLGASSQPGNASARSNVAGTELQYDGIATPENETDSSDTPLKKFQGEFESKTALQPLVHDDIQDSSSTTDTISKTATHDDSEETPRKQLLEDDSSDSTPAPTKAPKLLKSTEPISRTTDTLPTVSRDDDSMETPPKKLLMQGNSSTPATDTTEATRTGDPHETPYKQPIATATEADTTDEHETSRMKLMESDEPAVENTSVDAYETPQKAPMNPEQPESVSNNDSAGNETATCDKTYTQGNRLSVADGQQAGSSKRIHKFLNPGSVTTRRERVEFVRETVAFICACLNENADGTIHFGITRQSEGSQEEQGIIEGVQTNVDRWNEFQEEFTKSIQKCFEPDQIDTVGRSIRSLQYIPVNPASAQSDQQTNLCVIEVKVSPTSNLNTEEAFFVKLPSFHKKKVTYSEESLFYRCIDGEIRACSEEERRLHMQSKLSIANERRDREEQEEASRVREHEIHEDLRLKLCELLCQGEDSMPVDTYPILVVNRPPAEMTDEEMKQKLSFLANVPFKATFDFDENTTLSTYIDTTEKIPIKVISTTDDFSATSPANQRAPDRLKNLQEEIKNSRVQSWIYANGHLTGRKEPYEWNLEAKVGFREAMNFYHQEIPRGRALIVFLLLSDDLDVMIEASEELVMSFHKQWMVISENEALANIWAERLIVRNRLGGKTWRENSIINTPLFEVSESIKYIQGPVNQRRHNDPILVTKRGGTIPLRESLPDLDVLSYSQCDNFHPKPPAKFRKQKEEEYYKGGEVDWWNFWYEHVLHRTKLHDLKTLIENCVKGRLDGEHQIGRIGLYHQAGAGGTTLAMNALWDHRKLYRCAVVDNISDPIQTAQQILKLREYGEEDTPNPVLILLDNLEDEKSNLLLAELEEKAKQIWRMDSVRNNTAVCVLINCVRRNQLPSELKNKRILLKHELDAREKDWFEKKYQVMEKEHAANLSGDPKLLISFNIMKQEFNTKYMERTVVRLLEDVTDPLERKLLKFVAVVNAFDIQSQSIPTAVFDMMMTKTVFSTGLRYGEAAYTQRWEIKLSSAVKVLLNVSSQVSMGYIHAIEIVSPLLSKYIVDTLRKKENQTISDVAMELFDTTNIFKFPSLARDKFVRIVQEVLKSRAKGKEGVPEKKFSPIIQRVLMESHKKAVELMEAGYELTKDPFVAQQLARLYIHGKMWGDAKRMAKVATDTKSDSSYLWDTHGRAYLEELTAHFITILNANKPVQPSECATLVEIAFTGISIFRRVQTISMEEKHSMAHNNAGYFGELQIIRYLLDCLLYVPALHTEGHLKRFLVDPDYDVPELAELENHIDDARMKLKDLADNARNAITSLENEHIQLRDDSLDESKRKSQQRLRRLLYELKSHLYPYFGEEEDEPPGDYSEEQKCSYRRRRLFQLGAYNMLQIFDLKDKDDGEKQLKKIARIVSKNINSDHENPDDLQVMLCVNITLVQTNPVYVRRIQFEDMVNMSQRLYEKRDTRRFIHLEPYLFYIMFNWPQKIYQAEVRPGITHQTRRATTTPINHTMFTSAIKCWKEAYFEKYPRQREQFRKKDTTLFFFANGSEMNSIISQASLKLKGIDIKGEAFWDQPKVQRELRRFDGQLCEDGDKVKLTIEYPSGHKDLLEIPTSFPIRNTQMWNKKVYFVVGFSWKGPKAFHISRFDPTEDPAFLASDNTHDYRPDYRSMEVRPRNRPPHHGDDSPSGLEPHVAFLERLSKITKQLQEIDALKVKQHHRVPLSPVERNMLQQEHYLQSQRDHLIRSRARALGQSSDMFE